MPKDQLHLQVEPEVLRAARAKAREQDLSLQEYATEALSVVNSHGLDNLYPLPEAEPSEPPVFTFCDLFAGIGGIRLAFEKAGGQCVFSSEWDKFAKRTYRVNYGERPKGDITQIPPEDIPDHDILTAGFPCQPFSIAGVSKKNSLGRKHGFKDKTQGTLFFNIKEIIKAKRPRMFLLENVKNLKSHDKGRTFQVVTETMEELNYEMSARVVDARDYVPQHRERIFMVGFDREVFDGSPEFEFPKPPVRRKSLNIKTILEKKPDPKYVLSDKLWDYLQGYAEKHRLAGNGFGFGLVDGKENKIARTLSARYYKDGSEILVKRPKGNPRRLTPRECAKLMGYPASFKIPVSDTQAYKQFGNSVVVPVVTAIALRMKEYYCGQREPKKKLRQGQFV